MATIAEPQEKISLNSYAKKHVRYGSMAKEGMKTEKHIKHIVQPGDTLQGLALRYGVTMEQIKRANKMWTADSLFLRSSLDIPVDQEAFIVSSISSAPQTPQTSPVKHPSENQNGHSFINCQTSIDLSDIQLNASITTNNGLNGVEKEESAADFLIRIDSHIAQTKDKVLRLQHKVVYSEDDLHNSRDGFSPRMSYQYQTTSLTGSSSLSNLNVDPSIAPQPVIMTKGRKVKSSLKKLERQQDEIFEL
uniref:LysM and hypothetical peptidoglycan-binding domain-containing protein 2 n=1 Tax=Parasteatoda tepidariorum TaxID=114398 RepID=A0A2L2YI14_PARTP